MVVDDQADVIEFLGSARAHGGACPERIDTHASVVFLAGARALKLKRAVWYPYLDFSTAERRRALCEAVEQLFLIETRHVDDPVDGCAGPGQCE
jgi:hypothetical protein